MAAQLVTRVVARRGDLWPGTPVVLDTPGHLAAWCGRFGFVDDAPYADAGIPHLPKRRP